MKDIANKVDSVDTLPANAFNSIASELENVVTDSGQTLDATAETDPDPTPTQISRAITEGALGADFYTDSGAADAYILTTAGSWRQPTAYVTGMAFRFVPGNANTGVSTVNISGLGVKTIKQEDGTALLGGQLAAAKTSTIYYDGTDFKLLEAGGGAGGLGGVNLLEDEANAASGVGNWVSSGATLAISQETSTIPLNGVRDTAIKLTIGGTPNAGDYQAIRFTLSTSLKNLLLGIKWFQQVSAFTTDSLKIELHYNAASNYGGAYTEVPLSSDDGSGDTYIPNATDPVTNMTYMEMGNDYYELRFIVTANAVGNEIVYINDLETGPDNIESGAANGPWIDFTPNWTGTPYGLASDSEYKWRRVGPNMEISVHARGDGTGAGSGNVGLDIPGSEAIGDGANTGLGSIGMYGVGSLINGSVYEALHPYKQTPTLLYFGTRAAFGLAWSDVANTAAFNFHLSIPIAGWENTGVQHQLSNDLVSSNARMRAERTNSSTISTTGTVIFEDETNDNVSAYNPATGIYTTKSAGDFNVKAMFKFTATTLAVSVVSIEKNGTIVASRTFDTIASSASIGISDTLSCAKGDTIEIVWAGDATSPAFSLTAADNILTIERESDYSARQPVGFAGATPDFSGLVKVALDVFSTHNISVVNVDTAEVQLATHTIVSTGKYLMSGQVTLSNGQTNTLPLQWFGLFLRNGAALVARAQGGVGNAGGTDYGNASLSLVADLVAGDVISLKVAASAAGIAKHEFATFTLVPVALGQGN